MSDKTAAFLHTLVADAFKREVDADEAVWRSLPFFAALAGLGLAVLPGIYASISAAPSDFGCTGALALFATAALTFAGASYWFWQVIRPRRYETVSNEVGLMAYARSLHDLFVERGAAADAADAAVLDEIRSYVTEEVATIVEVNRSNNLARSHARSQVLLFVAIGFVLAFLAEATILSAQALSPKISEQRAGGPHGRDAEAERGALARDPRGSAPHDHTAAHSGRMARRQPVAIPSQQVPAQAQAVGPVSVPTSAGRGEQR